VKGIAHYRALPRRFRRATVLLVGCGDVGLRLARERLARHPEDRLRVVGVARSAERAATLRAAGLRPLRADLDQRSSLNRLKGLARWMVDLAPPPSAGATDPRTARLIAALARSGPSLAGGHAPAPGARRAAPADRRRWVYVSTTGVCGDCGGARFDETRPVAPRNDRAVRRVAAERLFRGAARRGLAATAILRAPGIYAQDRLPLDRLKAGLPALRAQEDVYTNHIHADDLARLCFAALFRGRPGRVIHAVDDNDLRMGDYFDCVADALELPRPPRLSRAEVAARVSPAMLSFMSESRRLMNARLKRELRVRLDYPRVEDTLAAARALRAATPRPLL
jgi:nucleoside-diphosphate-sugar epimerase